MEFVRLAIVGAGSVRCSPAVIASLATYFGERPLQIRMYDADEERLDLFDRFARLCFLATKATHNLISTADPAEALEEATYAIFQIGENCARKFLHAEPGDPNLVARASDRLAMLVPDRARVLSLQRPDAPLPLPNYRHLDWPGSITEDHRRSVPLQVLRYLNEEEYVHEIVRDNERSPLKDWLNETAA